MTPTLEDPDDRWTDWSAPAYVSVQARTAEEAAERIAEAVKDANLALAAFGSVRRYKALVQLANDHQLPEPS